MTPNSLETPEIIRILKDLKDGKIKPEDLDGKYSRTQVISLSPQAWLTLILHGRSFGTGLTGVIEDYAYALLNQPKPKKRRRKIRGRTKPTRGIKPV